MARYKIIFIFCLVLILIPIYQVSAEQTQAPDVPIPNKVTMVDLGAHSCIPCKMMAPILEELQEEYKNRAAIVFIDLEKHPQEAKKFNLKTIPTQIFFDKHGEEVYRHQGFMDKKSIVEKLQSLGVSK
jgi:thioredoxin 1